jgi:hypothetical protein
VLIGLDNAWKGEARHGTASFDACQGIACYGMVRRCRNDTWHAIVREEKIVEVSQKLYMPLVYSIAVKLIAI